MSDCLRDILDSGVTLGVHLGRSAPPCPVAGRVRQPPCFGQGTVQQELVGSAQVRATLMDGGVQAQEKAFAVGHGFSPCSAHW